jgi:hypothetical protein
MISVLLYLVVGTNVIVLGFLGYMYYLHRRESNQAKTHADSLRRQWSRHDNA